VVFIFQGPRQHALPTSKVFYISPAVSTHHAYARFVSGRYLPRRFFSFGNGPPRCVSHITQPLRLCVVLFWMASGLIATYFFGDPAHKPPRLHNTGSSRSRSPECQPKM
ncbi:unnamed protein product, partial [Ectocarpus sp. 12 AP-2014]